MNRRRISTTVDGGLLEQARRLDDWPSDATMIDAALEALAARFREAEIDAAYEAYDRLPLGEPDRWGDLASFHRANLTHGDLRRREPGPAPDVHPPLGRLSDERIDQVCDALQTAVACNGSWRQPESRG